MADDSFEQDVRHLASAFFLREEINTAVMPFEEVKAEAGKHVLAVYNDDSIIKMKLFLPDGSINTIEDQPKEKTENRRLYKDELKKVLYRLLSEYKKEQLPWGTLTGIRPTKVAYTALDEGRDAQYIDGYMKEHYLCSKEKRDLSILIAGKERRILEDIGYRNGYSIYIGIPFCITTCLYCSFGSHSLEHFGKYTDGYLEALFKEIDFAAKALPSRKLMTVYIGGGTPTALNEAQLERLLAYVCEKLPMKDVLEFSVEAGRPDSITVEKLRILKKYGVSRISINPQTMNDKTLKVIGRRHSAEDIATAFKMAREEGHDNINMDIIIGLPGENAEDVRYTLGRIEEFDPESLTVHSLAIKRAAALNERLEEMKASLPADTQLMQTLTVEYAAKHGYEPYYLYRQKNISDNLENVGYCKPGRECIYNIVIMEEKHTILALGAGAASKFIHQPECSVLRVENVKSVIDYIERVDEMIERKRRVCHDY